MRTFAQQDSRSSAQIDRDATQACREAVAELEASRKQIAGYRKLDVSAQELIGVQVQRIAYLEQTVASLKAALATGQKIEGLDDKIIASWEASLKDARAQIEKLTRRVSLWRRLAVVGTVAGLVIGVVISN